MDNPSTPAPAAIPAACVILPDRGVLAIQGPDRHRFLQGLVSNDIIPVSTERTVYTAFLTPQGKYLHDFFVVEIGDALYLDVEAERSGDLLRRLKLYKLRAQISLEDVSTGFVVAALFGAGALPALGLPPVPGHARPLAGGAVYVDPRLSALGARAILPRTEGQSQVQAILEATDCDPAPAADYDRHRLVLGVPDGSRDLVVEKAILLENNLDELNAISWDKGCYMGQELTARTRYRGLVRKRLFPVDVEGPLPEAGTAVMIGDREIGEMRSGRDGHALALLRLEDVDKAAAEGAPLTAGAARIIPRRPDWVHT